MEERNVRSWCGCRTALLLSLQQALYQESGLLARVELLITREEEERRCFLCVWILLFLPVPNTAGSPKIEQTEKKAPVTTLLQVSPAQQWVRTWFQGWHSGLETSRLIWLVVPRCENSFMGWTAQVAPLAKVLPHQDSSLGLVIGAPTPQVGQG